MGSEAEELRYLYEEEEKKMIVYTDEDIEDLVMSYEIHRGYWEDSIPQTEHYFNKGTSYQEIKEAMKDNYLIVFITINGSMLECKLAELLILFKYKTAQNFINDTDIQKHYNAEIKILRNIFDFLHVDLRDVPRYLSVYPELAAWRLRIGK